MTAQAQPHHIAEAKAIPGSVEEMRRAAADENSRGAGQVYQARIHV